MLTERKNVPGRIAQFIKDETVLFVAFVLTLISVLLVPPSLKYLEYLNYSVLSMLFCLMAVVQGFQEQGVFKVISASLLRRTKNLRLIGIILMVLCFFSAMVVTNDVALITFVPLTFVLLGDNDRDEEVLFIIVMETIAANLGSMVTPIGNPQNLYLYYFYNMEIGEFLRIMLPYGAVSLALLLVVMWVRMKNFTVDVPIENAAIKSRGGLIRYIILFAVCLLTVLKVVDYRICFCITVAALLLSDRGLFRKIDYMLLLTFVCFFVFVGNISSIPAVQQFMGKILSGRTFAVSVGLSQIISNVPAATMLSGFTGDYQNLILGVNIGGLGTLVASLASLISYKFYARFRPQLTGRYLLHFTGYNVLFLVILIAIRFVL